MKPIQNKDGDNKNERTYDLSLKVELVNPLKHLHYTMVKMALYYILLQDSENPTTLQQNGQNANKAQATTSNKISYYEFGHRQILVKMQMPK